MCLHAMAQKFINLFCNLFKEVLANQIKMFRWMADIEQRIENKENGHLANHRPPISLPSTASTTLKWWKKF